MSTESRSSVDTASECEGKSELGFEKPWKFTQWFKKMSETSIPDSDVLSAVSFDQTGKFLASGDRGGRVVVLRADDSGSNKDKGHDDPTKNKKLSYKFFCEFQSHDVDFDYVRSQAIEEKINKIEFMTPTCESQFILTTNDRVVKLWKLKETDIKYASSFNTIDSKGRPKSMKRVRKLQLPKTEVVESLVTAQPRRIFAQDIHKFNIHSLRASVDGETFLSADNLSINQWHIDQTSISYNIVNIKPDDMTQLTEVITVAELDNHTSNMFMYGTNRGIIRLGDLRTKALNDYPSKMFVDPKLEQMDQKLAGAPNRPFLADMLRSISDIKFSGGGRFIVSRDYMNIKVWDVRMEKQPVETIAVHDYLHPRLWELYENEYLFDCFDVAVNEDGSILTGSYNNFFHVFDMYNRSDTLVEASKAPIVTCPIVNGDASNRDSSKSVKKRSSRPGLVSLLQRKKKKDGVRDDSVFANVDLQSINFDKRVMQLDWHPNCNAIAVASENNLLLYQK